MLLTGLGGDSNSQFKHCGKGIDPNLHGCSNVGITRERPDC